MYLNKVLSLALIAIVVALPILTLVGSIPITFATITGMPTLEYYNGSNIVPGNPIQVPAVLKNNEALIINVTGMTVSGHYVWLWFSTIPEAAIDSSDAAFIGPISWNAITNTTGTTNVTVTVYSPFSGILGSTITVSVGKNMINITKLPGIFNGNDNYYIKITDVDPSYGTNIASSDVATSQNAVQFTPVYQVKTESVNSTSSYVVPDTPMEIYGFALPSGHIINISIVSSSNSVLETKNVTSQVFTVTYTPPSSTLSGEWNWTGINVSSFKVPDLGLVNLSTDTIKVNYTDYNVTPIVTKTIANLTEVGRAVYLPGSPSTISTSVSNFRGDEGDYSTGTSNVTLVIGQSYNISLVYFPYEGSATIKLNSTTLGTVSLSSNGTKINYTMTIPVTLPRSGTYNLTITDNDNVVYWFLVYVKVVPYIEVTPSEGYVGSTVTVKGYHFNDYVNDTMNIWFEVYNTTTERYYALALNFTVTSATWSENIIVPHASSCVTRLINVTTDVGGNLTIGTIENETYITSHSSSKAYTTFTVEPKIYVTPNSISNNGTIVKVVGTGFCSANYTMYIDHSRYVNVKPNLTGDFYVEFIATNFAPGTHYVIFYKYSSTPVSEYTIVQKAQFTVTGLTLQDVINKLGELNASIVEVKNNTVTILTKLGKINTSLTDLMNMLSQCSTTLLNIQNGIATLQTSLGTINMSLNDLQKMINDSASSVMLTLTGLSKQVNNSTSYLATLIVKNGNNVIATIQTSMSELEPMITSINGSLIAINTTLGKVYMSIQDLANAQASLVELAKTSFGQLVGVIQTKSGEILANLTTVQSLIKAGLPVDTRTLLNSIQDLTSLTTAGHEDIEAKLNSIASMVSDVDTKIGVLSAVESDLMNIKNSLSSVSSTVSSNSAALSSIGSNVNNIKNAVSTLGSNVNNIASTVIDIKNAVSTLGSSISSVNTNVNSVKSEIGSLKSTVSSSSSSMSSSISSLSSKLNKVSSRVTTWGITASVLVIITLIIAAIAAFRKPQ